MRPLRPLKRRLRSPRPPRPRPRAKAASGAHRGPRQSRPRIVVPQSPESRARGAGPRVEADIPVCRSSPARPRRRCESARTARTSRAGRRGLGGRAAGALRESPRPWLCLAAPRPAASPCGDTQLPIPLPHPPRQAAAQLPPGRHCEWVSPRLLPLHVRWNQPVTRGRAPCPLPQVIASSSGQSAPSLPSRQPSARPLAEVGGQRERRAGMFTNKIGE